MTRAEQKKQIRSEILARRNSLNDADIERRSAVILDKLSAAEEFKRAQQIMLFAAFGSEIRTWPLLQEVVRVKSLVLPRVEGGKLMCCRVASLDGLVRSKFGILEPKAENEVAADSIDLIVVPGVAFDQRCYRAGYGAGHYDRLLAGYGGATIGICFELQIVPEIPVEAWDRRVDRVLTEGRCFESHDG